MSKVQELMNLVQKQTQASAESPQNNNPLGDISVANQYGPNSKTPNPLGDVYVANQPSKSVNSSYNDLAPKGRNVNPPSSTPGWINNSPPPPLGSVHSNHNFIVDNSKKNKKPIETGWMPGMMYVPHGGGSNQGF